MERRGDRVVTLTPEETSRLLLTDVFDLMKETGEVVLDVNASSKDSGERLMPGRTLVFSGVGALERFREICSSVTPPVNVPPFGSEK